MLNKSNNRAVNMTGMRKYLTFSNILKVLPASPSLNKATTDQPMPEN